MELRNGYRQTDIGVFPNDWEVKTLDKEIDLLTGYPFPSNKYSEVGIRLLRGSNVKRGETDWSENITQYWEQLTPELRPYLLQDGDIVIAMDGSLVGRSFARLSKTDLPALLLQRVARVRSNKIDIGYLKEFICSEYFTKYCDSVKTVSAIPHISPSDIRNFKIPIPPIKAEQTAIATVLSDADALISSLEKLIEKKRNIKQGAMQQLLKPKKGWDKKSIKEIVQTPVTDGPHETPVFYDIGIPFLSVNNLVDKKIDFTDLRYISLEDHISYSKKCKPQRNDILLGKAASVGKVAIVETDLEFNIWSPIAMIRVKSDYSSKYVYYYLQTEDIVKQIEFFTNSSSQGNIGMGDIEKIEIPLPKTLAEQKEITAILSDMDNEIAALEKKLSKSKMLKQGMMQELLTGKIRLV